MVIQHSSKFKRPFLHLATDRGSLTLLRFVANSMQPKALTLKGRHPHNYVGESNQSETKAIKRRLFDLRPCSKGHLKRPWSLYYWPKSKEHRLNHKKVTSEKPKAVLAPPTHFRGKLPLWVLREKINFQLRRSVTPVFVGRFSKTQACIKAQYVSFLQLQEFEASFKALEASFNLAKA